METLVKTSEKSKKVWEHEPQFLVLPNFLSLDRNKVRVFYFLNNIDKTLCPL